MLFYYGGETLENLSLKELLRSKEENRILTGKITGIEDEFYKLKNENISCAVLWYNEIKILIPSTHLGIQKINKSMIRGMLGAEIDFIVIEIDIDSNIVIASRTHAMQLRAKLELSKLKENDIVKVRILAVGVKHILVELFGKEIIIKAKRMEEYQKLGKKWDENDYIFLNQKGEPFVSENLTNKMPQFIKKYNLEHLTTYGLRHSFATLCSTLGMPPEVLHVIMGHADFDTTRKYYIHITEERKRNEMFKLYRQQNSEPELQKLISENETYFNKVIKLSIQDIKPEKIQLAS